MAAQMGASAAAARAHEELYAYWAGLRRSGRLPGRDDIHPDDFKRLLPTISLIDVHRNPLEFRLRLAGTGLYGVYGREITGRTLAEAYSATAARGVPYRALATDHVARLDAGLSCMSLRW